MAPLMFVTAFTGSASILIRPPDISSTYPFQSRNCSWKMSLPAHPDWIFQVTVAALGAPRRAPADAAAPDAGAAVAGALDERHPVMNVATPERPRNLRTLRRLAPSTMSTLPHMRSVARWRHERPPGCSCQDAVFVCRSRPRVRTGGGRGSRSFLRMPPLWIP